MQKELIVIVQEVRSLYNLGAIFRTADALGVKKIYLWGEMATPISQPFRLAKTALGAEKIVNWEYRQKILPLLKKLRKDGFSIVALEEGVGAKDYRQWRPANKTVLILGNEVNGVAKEILSFCDQVVSLPMNGSKNSLNVAVAFGAIGYYFLAE